MGLNFTVIKIRRLPPLRNLEISKGFNFANALLSDFLQISQIRNRNKQNTKRKHSKLLGIKDKSYKPSSSSNASNASRSCSKSI